VLFDRYCFAQPAVDIHCKAQNLLAIEQRKLQLAFKDAVVRIVELHGDFGDREAPADFAFDEHLLQAHRQVGAAGDDELRAHPAIGRRRGNFLHRRDLGEDAAGNREQCSDQRDEQV
jgi:hypothetical protein